MYYEIRDEMEFVDYVPDVDDGDGELAQYENRTFKSDARISTKMLARRPMQAITDRHFEYIGEGI